MNSCSIGAAARLPNRTLRTTSSHKNGDKTGGFLSIAGTRCERTISSGGASVCGLWAAFFTYFASITCSDFIVSTLFRGGRGRTNNFSPLIETKCSSERAAAPPISCHVMTTHRKIVKRINATAKNIYALSWKRPLQRGGLEKTLARC